MRPGGGVVSPDHVLPNVPDRVDPSRADRHPISPVRERSDSRRVRGLPDRSHSPPGRARDGPHARARGDISVSPDRDVGRNRSPGPAAVPDRGSEARSRQPRVERTIRGSGSISPNPSHHPEVVGIIGLMPTSRVPVMNGGLLEAEPAPTPRVPAIGEGLLELLRIVDRPQRRLQEGFPAVMAQTRQRFVPSMIPMTVGTRMLNSRA